MADGGDLDSGIMENIDRNTVESLSQSTKQSNTESINPHKPGVAKIKPQYINHNHKRQVAEKYLPKEAVDEIKRISKYSKSALEERQSAEQKEEDNGEEKKDDSTSEPPSKKQKLKGRNKKRPKDKKTVNKDKLCPHIAAANECSFGENCRFCHDIQQFLDRQPSIDGKCYLFETFGKCWFGVACVFYKSHTLVEDNFKQIVNTEKVNSLNNVEHNSNNLSKETQVKLWRRNYNFNLAEKSWKFVSNIKMEDPIKFEENLRAERPKHFGMFNNNIDAMTSSESVIDITNTKDISNIKHENMNDIDKNDAINQHILTEKSNTKTATVKDPGENGGKTSENDAQMPEDIVQSESTTVSINIEAEGGPIKLRLQEKKKVNFRDKLYLAPLTTVGNLPFRRICKEFGADITCSEMATSLGLLQGHRSEWALLRRHHTEDLFGAQICGAYPDMMTKTAQVVMENTDIDFLDINCGCPIDLFYKKGEGCGLLSKTTKLYNMVRSMQGVMNVPLTVKLRTGIIEGKNIAERIMLVLKDLGVSMVTLHGRSREQRYTRMADWNYINQCAEQLDPMPVFGNGDILSYEDYNLQREQTKVSGCMIARGALMKPWVFTEIKEQRHWDISAQERLEMLRKFTNYGLENWGSDIQGVQTTRRFLLEWLSFLYRYIPVGILEHVPQKINEKPPRYFGRNDLETLMASPNCADWIKISEMLLGPVQQDFQFLPKHKANSYQ